MKVRKVISISLSEEVLRLIDNYSKETGIPRSRLIEKAIYTYLGVKLEPPTPSVSSENAGVKSQPPKVSELAVEEMKKAVKMKKLDPNKFW